MLRTHFVWTRGYLPTILFITLELYHLNDASAQLVKVIVEDEKQSNETQVYRMTISSAAETVPAFKYSLANQRFQMKEGSAIPFYYRALHFAQQVRMNETKNSNNISEDDWSEWISPKIPLEKLDLAKVESVLKQYDNCLKEIEEAARRTENDWDFKTGDLPGQEAISFLLPEMQEMRHLARLNALRTRYALANNNIDDAIYHIKNNLKLGIDVAQPNILICDLIGVAVASISLYENTLELITLKDCPNLYWALSELPDPIIDMTSSVNEELTLPERMIPVLIDPESQNWSDQEWGRQWMESIKALTYIEPLLGDQSKESTYKKFLTNAGIAVYFSMKLPIAKQEMKKRGYTDEQLNKMPAGQILAIQASFANRYICDEFKKCWHMPYNESVDRFSRLEKRLKDEGYMSNPINMKSKEIIPVASLLIPATGSVRQAQERLRAQVAMLRVIEAIRMHAHQTGSFPKNLEEITVVPVPENPLTGKPFDFSLNKSTAVLSMETVRSSYRFELTLRD